MPADRAPGRHLPDDVALGLLEAREAAGWSLREVARRVGIGAPHLCRLENGTRVPSRTLAVALVELYGLEHRDPDTARRLYALAVPDAGCDHPAYRRSLLPSRQADPMGNTP